MENRPWMGKQLCSGSLALERERYRAPKGPKKTCVSSCQHSKRKQTKIKRKNCIFPSGAQKCGLTHENLLQGCRSCARGWKFLKGKEQYLNKGTIIPLISLLWQEVSQSSLGWPSYLKDGPLARGSTFPSGVLSLHQTIPVHPSAQKGVSFPWKDCYWCSVNSRNSFFPYPPLTLSLPPLPPFNIVNSILPQNTSRITAYNWLLSPQRALPSECTWSKRK